MSGRLRSLFVTVALFAAPVLVAAATTSTADAAPPKKDPLADAFAGQILFLDSSPPPSVGGPGWFSAHKIGKKEENSDKKWSLHTMVFLKKPLDTPKLDLMVYKIDKKTGNADFIQKIEQFPNADVRTFYFLITFRKEAPFEPNLKYQIKAIVPGGGAVAEGTIELTGKEEKIGGGDMDFTKGMDLGKPKEQEKASGPFDAEAAKDALKKVIYEDCKTAGSKGGDAKIQIKFASKDGKVLDASFPKDNPPPYSDATQNCIIRRFERAKTKPFTGDNKTIAYKINL